MNMHDFVEFFLFGFTCICNFMIIQVLLKSNEYPYTILPHLKGISQFV